MGKGVLFVLTSSLQSTTILYAQLTLTAASITSRRVQSSGEVELASLISAIKSGDTADAQSSLAELKMQGSTSADPSSAVGVFLASVSNSLAGYNIAGAQRALAVFESSAAQRVAPVSSSTALSLIPSERTGPGVSALGQDLLSLFNAIGSGDTAGAQSAYGSLSSLLESSGGSNSTYGDFLGNSSGSGSLYSLMAQIGTALSTGNITRVQGTMDTFMRNLSAGSLVSTSA